VSCSFWADTNLSATIAPGSCADRAVRKGRPHKLDQHLDDFLTLTPPDRKLLLAKRARQLMQRATQKKQKNSVKNVERSRRSNRRRAAKNNGSFRLQSRTLLLTRRSAKVLPNISFYCSIRKKWTTNPADKRPSQIEELATRH
jgi:hypothetical protein